MQMRTRKALGCFALLAYVSVYTILAVTLLAAFVPALPFWAQFLVYAVAGVIWIFPLRPLFNWMNRGQ